MATATEAKEEAGRLSETARMAVELPLLTAKVAIWAARAGSKKAAAGADAFEDGAEICGVCGLQLHTFARFPSQRKAGDVVHELAASETRELRKRRRCPCWRPARDWGWLLEWMRISRLCIVVEMGRAEILGGRWGL
jgi:hypothetical protein